MNENNSWVGVVLIVIFLVGGGVWYGQGLSSNKKVSIEDQSICSEKGKLYYDEYVLNSKMKEYQTGGHYESYFNNSLGKCFLYIEFPIINFSAKYRSYHLVDPIAKKIYLDMGYHIEDNKYIYDICELTPNGRHRDSLGKESETIECKSKEEFEKLIKPYMTE
jgi:hypothetical protein